MDDLQNRVERLLDQKVRPILKRHGGDIKFSGIRDGILELRLSGPCSGCPSAMLEAEQFFSSGLFSSIPEIRDVSLTDKIDASLLEQAYHLLISHE